MLLHNPHRRIPIPKHRLHNKFGYVFCHRGLYDRAKGYPENSLLAVENGLRHGMWFHELDGNIRQQPSPYRKWQLFIAHDRVAGRVTSKKGTWSTYKLSSIMETALVTRRFDPERQTFATSYLNTTDKVPFLGDLDPVFHEPGAGIKLYGVPTSKWLQVDLRGSDLAEALTVFYHKGPPHDINVILKGYNVEFPTLQHLMTAAKRSGIGFGDLAFSLPSAYPYIAIMVFYPYPVVNSLLRARGINPDHATDAQKLSISYRDFYAALWSQVQTFVDTNLFQFIFEIVHSGLGLGYNIQTGKAVNPLDGTAIKDDNVLFESRIDRAMIDISLALRQTPHPPYFGSCTRLCDVRTSKEEMTASYKDGHIYVVPKDERGLNRKIRGIHGGLYPQSDVVVADDPFAEIAARTWIDEYAKLDRRQLLTMPYNRWLAQAGQTVVTAVNSLNGPFMPNTFDGPMDNDGNILVPH